MRSAKRVEIREGGELLWGGGSKVRARAALVVDANVITFSPLPYDQLTVHAHSGKLR